MYWHFNQYYTFHNRHTADDCKRLHWQLGMPGVKPWVNHGQQLQSFETGAPKKRTTWNIYTCLAPYLATLKERKIPYTPCGCQQEWTMITILYPSYMATLRVKWFKGNMQLTRQSTTSPYTEPHFLRGTMRRGEALANRSMLQYKQ